MGRRQDAAAVVRTILERPLDDGDISLFSGLAGIGLALLELGGDESIAAVRRIAGHLALALQRETSTATEAGLMHGWSGPALLLIRLFEATGDRTLLTTAADALARDLDRCVWTDDDTLKVDQGWRLLPYLCIGSAGIGLVVDQLLRHHVDDELTRSATGLWRASAAEVLVQSGLFNGRAGLMLHLAGRPGYEAALRMHLANLAWHGVPYEGHLAFVGDQLLRLSMDLATGSAGVLLALASVLGEGTVTLPFLERTEVSSVIQPTRGGDERWQLFSNFRR